MGNYRKISDEVRARIEADGTLSAANPFGFRDEDAVWRKEQTAGEPILRPAFVRDCEKILHLPQYGRYADKTQVFSFYENDDISRRWLHVQLVARIARNIGRALGLNCDLIEAIALGHDIGHTPFGHAGEKALDHLYNARTGRHFAHNVQSARVLDVIYRRGVSLQTLDGILCHNGESEAGEYCPAPRRDFDEFDRLMEECEAKGNEAVLALSPGTLEGCVVRISDVIAYLGRDRQDAAQAAGIDPGTFSETPLGSLNAEIINNISADIVENSYRKPTIRMSVQTFAALKSVKAENYEKIYKTPQAESMYNDVILPMFTDLYQALLDQLKRGEGLIFTHHILPIEKQRTAYGSPRPYHDAPADRIVADYLSGMTDDYFFALHRLLFPGKTPEISSEPYFK